MIWLTLGVPVWLVLVLVVMALCRAAAVGDAQMERMAIQLDKEKHAPILHERLR